MIKKNAVKLFEEEKSLKKYIHPSMQLENPSMEQR